MRTGAFVGGCVFVYFFNFLAILHFPNREMLGQSLDMMLKE